MKTVLLILEYYCISFYVKISDLFSKSRDEEIQF